MKAALVALLPYLLPLALSALTAGTAYLFAHLGSFLKARATSSNAFAALAVLNDTVSSVVADIEANEKAEVTAYGAKALTPEEGKKLRDIALNRLKNLLGTEGLTTLQKALGALLGVTNLDTLLTSKIEQAVAKLPSTGTTSAVAQTALGVAGAAAADVAAALAPKVATAGPR